MEKEGWREKKSKGENVEKNTQPRKAAASDNDLTFCGVEFNKKNKLTARTRHHTAMQRQRNEKKEDCRWQQVEHSIRCYYN